MDVHIIIDSIADVMSHEDKDLCKTGELAIKILYETITIVVDDRLKVGEAIIIINMSAISILINVSYWQKSFAKVPSEF